MFFLDPKMGFATPQVCVCVTKTEGLCSRVKEGREDVRNDVISE